METIGPNEISIRRTARDFRFLRIAAPIPFERLKSDVVEAVKKFRPIKKDGYQLYSGIGLQFIDSTNPIFDGVQQCKYFAADGSEVSYRPHLDCEFVDKNKIGLKLQYLYDVFQGVPLFRGRILIAQPGHVLDLHRDGEHSCRIHIPIVTNEKCHMQIDDEHVHMPADGSAYLCNTSLLHRFGNLGTEERIHIVFAL